MVLQQLLGHFREEFQPGPDEVLIKVKATAVNRADLMQKNGVYPPPPGASQIMGLECSGTIEAVGLNVSSRIKGEEVCALLAGGGYAEYVTCPAEQVVPTPKGLNWIESASIPEVYATSVSYTHLTLPTILLV